jgi:hypothetical protein
MSYASKWLRAGALSALLVGIGTRAEAWDLLHRCPSNCPSQTVQIPAQNITVETVAPRVVVQQTRALAVVPAPMVASFYVPAPVNLGVVGLAAPPADDRESVNLDFSALRAAHDLERCQARANAVKAIYAAQADQMSAVMNRVAQTAAAAAPPQTPPPPPPAAKGSASNNCCEEIKAELDKLTQRVVVLEQNLNTVRDQVKDHDVWIRQDPNNPKIIAPKLPSK